MKQVIVGVIGGIVGMLLAELLAFLLLSESEVESLHSQPEVRREQSSLP